MTTRDHNLYILGSLVLPVLNFIAIASSSMLAIVCCIYCSCSWCYSARPDSLQLILSCSIVVLSYSHNKLITRGLNRKAGIKIIHLQTTRCSVHHAIGCKIPTIDYPSWEGYAGWAGKITKGALKDLIHLPSCLPTEETTYRPSHPKEPAHEAFVQWNRHLVPSYRMTKMSLRVARMKIGSKITSLVLRDFLVLNQLWKTVSSSSELQMSPHFWPRIYLNPLYNFRALAETQFPLIDDEKWVRSRAIDQKAKGGKI
ncbi:hypothetical protein LguiA_012907 [Lonicera macranthoides]